MDFKNMDCALIKRFTSFIDLTYCQEYKQQFIKRPDATFLHVFKHFTQEYGNTDEDDRLDNEHHMLADWHPQQGIMALMNQLEEGIIFVKVTENQLTDERVVDIGISVIQKTGAFTHGYMECLE